MRYLYNTLPAILCLMLLTAAKAPTALTENDRQLLKAAREGNIGTVQALIKAKANVHVANEDGRTPLMLAIWANHLEVVKKFIQVGANVNQSDIHGRTPLIIAVQGNSPEIVEELIKAKADVNMTTKLGWTALMIAAQKSRGHRMVTALIQAGADVYVANKDGWAPLMLAVQKYGNLATIQELLQAGAEVNAADEDGWTALMQAVDQMENTEVEVVQELIKAKANVNAANKYGRTALEVAVNTRLPGVIQALLLAGADPHLKDEDGYTAYDHARSLHMDPLVKKEILKLLAETDLERKLNQELRAAVREGQKKKVKELLKKGANPNSKDINGDTALIIAVRLHYEVMYECCGDDNAAQIITTPYKKVIQLLLRHKNIDLNIQTRTGKTVLMEVIGYYNDPKIINKLLQAGADANITDKSGYTALMYAVDGGNTEIIRRLLRAGANPHLKNKEGKTARDIVLERLTEESQKEILPLLGEQ